MPLNRPKVGGHGYVREGDPLPPEDRAGAPPLPGVGDLYRNERPRLLSFLRRMTSSDAADDLVQQTFARFIAKQAHGPIPGISHEGYLRRTARNLFLNDCATAQRQSRWQHFPLEDAEPRAPDQIAALEARDLLQRLEAGLQKLKPRTREIFLAHRIDGYSYGEIAARTGLSVKGVEKHMSRAIAHIDRTMSAR